MALRTMLSTLHGTAAPLALTATAAFALAACLTPLVRALARRFGVVAAPKADRWHRKPTAMMGGVAIFASVAGATLLLLPQRRETWFILGASAILFAVGLVDDFLHIKPYQKLIGQIVGAAIVVYSGLVLPWTGSATVNMFITLFWLIGLTNAVNMLDNMDGLSAGVAAIAAVFLAINFHGNGQPAEAALLAGFAAALAGFLIYNYHPASIFMGDCGSLFVGFFLAGSALLSGTHGGRSRSLLSVLAVPVLVLCVPIFDTTFVTLMRKLAGRAASQGGRDHTSHRLVALGLSEKHAVWMLYSLAIAAGTISLLVRHVALDVSLMAIATFVMLLTFLGIHLGGVRVYAESEIAAARGKPLVAVLLDISHRRRIFEVLLDVILIPAAYYLAYVMKFGTFNGSSDWQLFLQTVPVVLCVKVPAFLVSGVYRGMWKYAGIDNVLAIARAVALSSVAALLAIVFAFRFDGFSRTVFAADGVILLLLVTGSRFAFRLLRHLMPAPHARTARRVLIYGAGDAGQLLVRELSNNTALRRVPVAFVDDNPNKVGSLLEGLRVHSVDTPFAELLDRARFEEVVLSTAQIAPARVREIVTRCEPFGIAVRRLRIAIEPVANADPGRTGPADEPALAGDDED